MNAYSNTADGANAEDDAPSFKAYDLVCEFYREIYAASACINVLRRAILQCDIIQISMTGNYVHQAWRRAASLLASLEATSGTRQAIAREALWDSSLTVSVG